MSKKEKAAALRIILIGDCRVGKTSLLNKVVGKDKTASRHYPPTIGVEYATTVMHLPNSNKELKVQIWDTCKPLVDAAGAEKYQSITSSYYRKSQGAVLVFDITERQSFENIVKWLDSVKCYGDKNIAICLVANKIDLVESGEKSRAVSEAQLTDFCVQHGLGFKETSAITGHNVLEMFQDMLESNSEANLEIYETSCRGQYDHEYSELIKASFTSDQTIKKRTQGPSLERIKEEDESKCFKCC